MSLPTSPIRIYYTQKVLSDLFTLPIVEKMKDGLNSYVKTGKLPNIRPQAELILDPFWDRTLYSGIADGEADVDAAPNAKKINLSTDLDNLIEFAGRKQTREEKNIRGLIAQQTKLQQELLANASDKEAVRQDYLDLQGEIDGLKQELKRFNVKPKKNKTREQQIISVKGQRTQPPGNTAPSSSQPDNTTRYLERVRDRLANNLEAGKGLELNAADRLRRTRTEQMYATLNDRYPAVGDASLFREQYLKTRQGIVATSLNSKYQELIKNKVADYISRNQATGVKLNEKQVLEEIKEVYRSNDYKRYGIYLDKINQKQDSLKISAEEYIDYLKELDKSAPKKGSAALKKINAEIDKLTRKENRLNDQLNNLDSKANKTVKERIRLANLSTEAEEIEKQIDALEGRALSAGKEESWWQQRISKAQDHIRNEENVEYIDPRKKARFTKGEKSQLIKLLGLTEKNSKKEIDYIRNQTSFSSKELSKFKQRLKNKSLNVDEELYQIAARTANTEVAAAYNLGRLQAYLTRGVKYVQWISTIDAKTSRFCQSLHLKILSIADITTNALGTQRFPRTRYPEYHPINRSIKAEGNFNAFLPPAHPYCRSYLIPVYTDKDLDKYDPKQPELPPDARTENFLLDRILDKRKGGRLTDRQLQDLAENQERARNAKSDKLANEVNNFNDLFNRGLRFLTRKLRQEDVATFTVEEIKNNDKSLTAALLGGSAVMGLGAMMYFFLKSNLGASLQEYLRTKTTSIFGKQVVNLTDETVKSTLLNLSTFEDMPPVIKNLVKKEDLFETLDAQSTLPNSLQKIETTGEAGLNLIINQNMPPNQVADSFISNNLKGINRNVEMAGKYQAILNYAKNDLARYQTDLEDVLSRAYSNTAGAIDARDIKNTEIYYRTIRVDRFKGKSTFVSKDQFFETINDPQNRKLVDDTLVRVNQVQAATDQLADVIDPSDQITSNYLKKLNIQLTNLRNLTTATKTNTLNIPSTAKAAAEQRAKLDALETLRVDNVNQLVKAEEDFGRIVKELDTKFNDTLPSSYLSNNLIPESITSVAELNNAKKIIKDSLKNIRSDYLSKGKVYTANTIAEKTGVATKKQIGKLKTTATNATRILNDNGINAGLTIPDIEKQFQNKVEFNYRELNEMLNRINNRINELE